MKQFMTAGGVKRRVLIVDDEIINLELLGAMLSESFDADFASNGEEAMAALTAPGADYSLILLDLMMPVMDGFEVIERCQANEQLRRIPIIVMTAEKSAEVRSIRMGAADFITKPYDMDEIILGSWETIKELREEKINQGSSERHKVSATNERQT